MFYVCRRNVLHDLYEILEADMMAIVNFKKWGFFIVWNELLPAKYLNLDTKIIILCGLVTKTDIYAGSHLGGHILCGIFQSWLHVYTMKGAPANENNPP